MVTYTSIKLPKGYVQEVPDMQTCKICSKQLIGRYCMTGQGFVCLDCGATLADNGVVVIDSGPSINIEELKHRRFRTMNEQYFEYTVPPMVGQPFKTRGFHFFRPECQTHNYYIADLHFGNITRAQLIEVKVADNTVTRVQKCRDGRAAKSLAKCWIAEQIKKSLT